MLPQSLNKWRAKGTPAQSCGERYRPPVQGHRCVRWAHHRVLQVPGAGQRLHPGSLCAGGTAVLVLGVCRPLALLVWLTTAALIQVDNRHQREPVISPEQAARVCDRNFGVGGDGVQARSLPAAPLGLAAGCK